ncbi:YciI family protein [Anaeromyxobacter terrae]|uniref:YciI family protein n=1 Tax=Anaeromyxobacter terrae TaxID=2925406 RepID=UPI001F586982|nr:YciI family protein [Anaeromyxobacter sp. SG22]
MLYMLMIIDERSWTMPKDERDALMDQYAELLRDIVKSGNFRGSGYLHPSSTATTVREVNGKRVTMDGPFAETKEQLGGYILVECKDLDEAISIAGRIPSIRTGGAVEVRPVAPTPVSV